MDLDRIPLNGADGLLGMPMGFASTLAMSEAGSVQDGVNLVGDAALTGAVGGSVDLLGYDTLTEAEKEEMILRCKGAKTREEMQKIVESVAPGVDVQQVYEEERENFI